MVLLRYSGMAVERIHCIVTLEVYLEFDCTVYELWLKVSLCSYRLFSQSLHWNMDSVEIGDLGHCSGFWEG